VADGHDHVWHIIGMKVWCDVFDDFYVVSRIDLKYGDRSDPERGSDWHRVPPPRDGAYRRSVAEGRPDFQLETPPGSDIIGFHGRCGRYIDAVGPIVRVDRRIAAR
jgi:hypothetical protein